MSKHTRNILRGSFRRVPVLIELKQAALSQQRSRVLFALRPLQQVRPLGQFHERFRMILSIKLTLQSHIVLDVSQGQLVLSLAVVRASNDQL